MTPYRAIENLHKDCSIAETLQPGVAGADAEGEPWTVVAVELRRLHQKRGEISAAQKPLNIFPRIAVVRETVILSILFVIVVVHVVIYLVDMFAEVSGFPQVPVWPYSV